MTILRSTSNLLFGLVIGMLFFCSVGFSVMPIQAHAADAATEAPQGDCNSQSGFDPCGTLGKVGLSTDAPDAIAFRIIKGFLSFIGILAVTLIIYGGFTWMTSGGSPEKVKKGKDVLLWATLGTLLILSSLGIVEFIDSFI